MRLNYITRSFFGLVFQSWRGWHQVTRLKAVSEGLFFKLLGLRTRKDESVGLVSALRSLSRQGGVIRKLFCAADVDQSGTVELDEFIDFVLKGKQVVAKIVQEGPCLM